MALATIAPTFWCAWLDGGLDDAPFGADYDNSLQIKGGGTRRYRRGWVDGDASSMGLAGPIDGLDGLGDGVLLFFVFF
jgi:hypothetical protein